MSVGDYSHHVSCSSPNHNNNLTATNNINPSYQYISPTDTFCAQRGINSVSKTVQWFGLLHLYTHYIIHSKNGRIINN